MPRPTDAQLRRINKFSQTKLDADQVYVFRSLSADTLPVRRRGWFGEYSINFAEKMLRKLKKDYKTGVGLLASHNNNRLPFGRTFDAELQVDEVGGDSVKTLYIDHYMVTHMKDDDDNKIPLRTEINGMTTQDIANHIEVGHTFDTSIGFSMDDIKCSICGNDLRDWEKCRHIPGATYEVDDEEVRCNIIAENGEGLENSVVYAGAVDRAIIQQGNFSAQDSENSANLQTGVNFEGKNLYNVDELKNVPKDGIVFCQLSKGNLTMFTDTSERRDFKKYIESKESEEMAKDANAPETTVDLSQYVSKEEFNKVVGEKEALASELDTTKDELATAKEDLATANGKVEELSPKAELAEKFTEDLIENTVKAGVAARGNKFNKERFEKYLRTLSVDEIKEELSAIKEEFPGNVEEARVTAKSVELDNDGGEEAVTLSKAELRTEAAKQAMAEFNAKGGDLAELTKQKYSELLSKQAKAE